MSGFTRGPWVAETRIVHPDMGGRHQTYSVVHTPHRRSDIRLGDDRGDEHNCKANAYLIAAAPDLYEALERMTMLADCGLDSKTEEVRADIRDARAALAKARGDAAT